MRTIIGGVCDQGRDAVTAKADAVAAFRLSIHPEFLHVLDAFVETGDVGLLAAKEHISTIMPDAYDTIRSAQTTDESVGLYRAIRPGTPLLAPLARLSFVSRSVHLQ